MRRHSLKSLAGIAAAAFLSSAAQAQDDDSGPIINTFQLPTAGVDLGAEIDRLCAMYTEVTDYTCTDQQKASLREMLEEYRQRLQDNPGGANYYIRGIAFEANTILRPIERGSDINRVTELCKVLEQSAVKTCSAEDIARAAAVLRENERYIWQRIDRGDLRGLWRLNSALLGLGLNVTQAEMAEARRQYRPPAL